MEDMQDRGGDFEKMQRLREIDKEYRKQITVITARPQIVRAAYMAWGALVALLLLFTAVSVVWYGVDGMFRDKDLVNILGENTRVIIDRIARYAPKQLEVRAPASVRTGTEGAYTGFVEVKNPNERHGVIMTYRFTASGGETSSRTIAINPKETVTVLSGETFAQKPSQLTLVIEKTQWTYLDRKTIENITKWYSDHAAFAITNPSFSRDLTYEKSTVARTTFSVENHSAYSYWQPVFVVKILRGETVLGVSEVALDVLRSGEMRDVELRWFGELPQTATVSVVPRIPFFLTESYEDPEAASELDARTRTTVE